MAADAEICMMAADTMEALGIARGQYVVKVNNRKVLDGVLESIGLAGEAHAGKRLTVLRAIDKSSLSVVVNKTSDTVAANKVLDFADTEAATNVTDNAAAAMDIATGPTSDPVTLDIDAFAATQPVDVEDLGALADK